MNTKTTPRDFFLHLGAMVALIAVVVSIINLSFSVINYYLPDQLAGYFYAGNVAWPISMLLVLVPLLYVLEYLIYRDIKQIPDKADLIIRRWRIYLTLFLTGATIIGDLITLINVYLSGEITGRFVYKTLSVLIVAGIVFAYYLLSKSSSISNDDGKKIVARKTLSIAGIIIVLIAVVFGFVVVGSPSKQRNLRFDNQRVSDLNNIQWQIINYWQQRGKLPIKLSELNDFLSGYKIPMDPKTDLPYEYSIVTSSQMSESDKPNKASFELCANFSLKTEDTKGRGEYGRGGVFMDYSSSIYYPSDQDNWKHDSGRTCFERVIDVTKYPINEKIRE